MGQSNGVLFKEVSVFRRCPLIEDWCTYLHINRFLSYSVVCYLKFIRTYICTYVRTYLCTCVHMLSCLTACIS